MDENGRPMDGKKRGFLPERKTIPEEFSGENLREWRNWKEDMEDYLDGQMIGMRAFLQVVAKEELPVNEACRAGAKGKVSPKILDSAVDLWRALKDMTKGEAKTIIKSVSEQDGFVA